MKLRTSFTSPHFDERRDGGSIDFLIYHYTACDLDLSLKLLAGGDPSHRVSAHYLISETGEIFALVDESKRAWHAGVSIWDGREDLNSRSIGIELVHPGHTPEMRPYAKKQIAALIELSHDIIKRYAIKAHHILGHSDIAPLRKADPGEHFPWKELAEEGIGLYPHPDSAFVFGGRPLEDLSQSLRTYGYQSPQNESEAQLILKAFQRHFCPEELGRGGTPETIASISSLLEKKNQV